MKRETMHDFHRKFILLEIFNWLNVYANDGGNVVRKQLQTLKAMTDSKLLTLNVLVQHLVLSFAKQFVKKGSYELCGIYQTSEG